MDVISYHAACITLYGSVKANQEGDRLLVSLRLLSPYNATQMSGIFSKRYTQSGYNRQLRTMALVLFWVLLGCP